MRKVTENMYNEARRKALRIISDGEHVFADPQNRKLYQAIRADAAEIEKSSKADIAYQQGLEVGYLLGVNAATVVTLAPKK